MMIIIVIIMLSKTIAERAKNKNAPKKNYPCVSLCTEVGVRPFGSHVTASARYDWTTLLLVS